jgi:NADH pyrophosphatase NudC (nudix superfamily)
MNDTAFRYCPSCRAELTTAERGGKSRLVCPECGFVQWRNPVPVVAAVVEREGQVILVHSIGRPPTWFGLVAGFLEQGEHPEAAVLREVDEELGIPAKLESCIGIYPFELFNQIIFAYHVRGGPGAIRLDASELDAGSQRAASTLPSPTSAPPSTTEPGANPVPGLALLHWPAIEGSAVGDAGV